MLLRIEKGSAVPISRQIEGQIATLCASGTLRPTDRLPSVRELARQLAVNQNTVLRVYERLVSAGLLEMRHGQGTFVAARASEKSRTAHRQRLVEEFRQLGSVNSNIRSILNRRRRHERSRYGSASSLKIVSSKRGTPRNVAKRGTRPHICVSESQWRGEDHRHPHAVGSLVARRRSGTRLGSQPRQGLVNSACQGRLSGRRSDHVRVDACRGDSAVRRAVLSHMGS